MSTSTAHTDDLRARWKKICSDPWLQDLPYKVETNHRGQLLLSPHTNRHSFTQSRIADLLGNHAPPGRRAPEFAIRTPEGIKSPDVVWMSPERYEEVVQSGDPTSVAPELCVEVLSTSNDMEEMREKGRLYFALGAKEMWVVQSDGAIEFFRPGSDGEPEPMEGSAIAPGCPDRLS